MTNWRLTTMNLHELLRRLRAHQSDRAISRALGVSRNTVKDYRHWAEVHHLLSGDLPDLATLDALRRQSSPRPALAHPGQASSVEAYRAEMGDLLDQGRPPRTIWRLLGQRHPDFSGSESAVWRLVQHLRANQPPEVVLRIETPPGEVAQVDFGFLGYLLDTQQDRLRKAWAFVMTLAWSRHQYAELVFDQTIPTWLLCHQHAFEFFGGVPGRVVLDNLKAAVIHAYTTEHDPEVQQAYRECAEHYGFLIDPCLPRKPQHKGKVERGGVGYLQQAFWPLVLEGASLSEGNRQLRQWLVTTAGLRVHGTTREVPLARFEHVERAALLPLPASAYDPAVWKRCSLHRDGHVTFEKSYYSAPYRLIGQTLWLRAGLREIRLFSEGWELVASHPRATQPGQRYTQPDHLPADKAWALTLTRPTCQAQAETIGPAAGAVVAELLAARPVDRFRTAVRVLRLAEEYTPARLEAACAVGLAYGDPSFCTLKRLLREGLETLPLAPAPTRVPETLVFARSADELAQAILGGAAWN